MATFFFFKQKTAYEVRISDWSSDVCSSDLLRARHRLRHGRQRRRLRGAAAHPLGLRTPSELRRHPHGRARLRSEPDPLPARRLWPGAWRALPRSEEHTSELQSLMRISYAVFCLKKKKTPYKERTLS